MDEYNFPLEKGKSQNAENLHQDGNFETIYRWLETIPFSKAPKTLARDFADGGKYLYKNIDFEIINNYYLCIDSPYGRIITNILPSIY